MLFTNVSVVFQVQIGTSANKSRDLDDMGCNDQNPFENLGMSENGVYTSNGNSDRENDVCKNWMQRGTMRHSIFNHTYIPAKFSFMGYGYWHYWHGLGMFRNTPGYFHPRFLVWSCCPEWGRGVFHHIQPGILGIWQSTMIAQVFFR